MILKRIFQSSQDQSGTVAEGWSGNNVSHRQPHMIQMMSLYKYTQDRLKWYDEDQVRSLTVSKLSWREWGTNFLLNLPDLEYLCWTKTQQVTRIKTAWLQKQKNWKNASTFTVNRMSTRAWRAQEAESVRGQTKKESEFTSTSKLQFKDYRVREHSKQTEAVASHLTTRDHMWDVSDERRKRKQTSQRGTVEKKSLFGVCSPLTSHWLEESVLNVCACVLLLT